MADSILDAAFLKKLERLAVVTRKPFAGRMKGEKRSLKRGASVEFADYRDYMTGDDLRYVDWNTAARLERLYVKLFIEEEDLFLALLIDTSKSMDFGTPKKLHVAARIAAALGYICLANYDRVSISGFAERLSVGIRPVRGRAGVPEFFRFLNDIVADGGTSLSGALRSFAAKSRQRGVAIVLTDLMDPAWQAGLKSLLARGFQVALVHILDSEETEPTVVGDLRIVDCETGESKEMSVNPALLTRYAATLAAFRAEAEAFAHRYGMDYVPMVTNEPVEDAILRTMRRGGLVK